MTRWRYACSKRLVAMLPGYACGVVVARGVANDEASHQLLTLLRDAERDARCLLASDALGVHPRVARWLSTSRHLTHPSTAMQALDSTVRQALLAEPMPAESAILAIRTILTLWHLAPVDVQPLVLGTRRPPTLDAGEVDLEASDIVYYLHRLPPLPLAELAGMCDEAVSLLEQFCGGTVRYEVLQRDGDGGEYV